MLLKDKQSLLGVLEAVEKIENYIKDFKSVEEFYKDQKSFDAALMNFVVIGEMIDRLSDDFKENNNNIDWFKIKGFRNIIAHDYFGVDADEVWEIIKVHLLKLKEDLSGLV